VPEGLNFCAAGEAYWSTDVGAFFPNGNWDPWFYEGDFDRGVEDPGYRELFVRWMQLAAFLPMMRAHGTGTPREIWQFGEKGEPFYDAIESAIRLRYRLVPYLYTLMAETNRRGVPMLRHPALVYSGDTALRQVNDQLLLGDCLLVKPVVRPMLYGPGGVPIPGGDDTETVTLPKGHDWYDLHTGRRYAGGQVITVHAPLDEIPMFVRAGTVLPLGAEVQHTAAQQQAPLEVLVFPGEDASFTLYEDAGDGYGYESGEYALTGFVWSDRERTLRIAEREGSYAGMPALRQLLVHVPGQEAVSAEDTGKGMSLQL